MRFLIIFLFYALNLQAQLIDNSEGRAFTNEPFFNAEFASALGLKKMEGTYLILSPHHSIKQTEYVKGFEFDSLGRLIRLYENYPDDGSPDTTEFLFEYDTNGICNSIRHKIEGGYRVKLMKHDSLSRLCEERVIIKNDTADGIPLYHNRIEYGTSEFPIRRIKYNSDDQPYMEEWFYFTGHLLMKKKERFRLSASNVETLYLYDKQERVVEKIVQLSRTSEILEHYKFSYEGSELSSIKKLKGDEVENNLELIYNENGTLASIIEEDSGTNAMTVIRFKNMEFY